jgi:hypothetical protein
MCRLREKLARYYQSEGARDEVRIRSGGGYLFLFEPIGILRPDGGQTCWLVLPLRAAPEIAEVASELHDELLFGLATVDRLSLVSPTTALAYGGRSGDVREFAAECHADFVVEGSIRRHGECFEARIWLVEGRSGRVQRTKKLSGSAGIDVATLTIAWLMDETRIHPDGEE